MINENSPVLSLFLLSSSAISALSFTSPSRAEDIPLFGLRKKLKKVEEEAEAIVKEGEEVVEKEIQVAEKGIEVVEEKIATGELGFGAGGVVQAGVVAGAEAVGVLVGVSVVNGILGPEGKNP
ncbi:uncharacterized protein LOC109842076 [Asparagus officinalis]|uniref:uncharacterized protein LOC109842076 n=1 Tax=Asparagus officinalis TaxID=4686 RepID=UPI00098E40E2|nr:uncharacterized protein LOC109842076 [Asparagus officinalis]